jgi:hypothetical protein
LLRGKLWHNIPHAETQANMRSHAMKRPASALGA